jgi:hypothetical protein
MNANQYKRKDLREAGLRAERSATGASNSIGLPRHWSGLERSDKIKDPCSSAKICGDGVCYRKMLPFFQQPKMLKRSAFGHFLCLYSDCGGCRGAAVSVAQDL